jgi:hypothetical protein
MSVRLPTTEVPPHAGKRVALRHDWDILMASRHYRSERSSHFSTTTGR